MNNVHFAIPEIYGESLSYYELLRKLVNKTNELIDNYNTVPEQIAEAVKNLDASQLFSTVLDQLIHSIATDNTKSPNAVKVYKKHDLLYATFNENVNMYESLIDFTTGTETELIPGTNIREVNISELFIEMRNIVANETARATEKETELKNDIDGVTSLANENSAEITTIHDDITAIENKNTEQDNELSTLLTMLSSPYNFKGDVASISALPASGAVNDTYYVQDVKYKVTWTGSAWVQSSLSEADYETELSELQGDLESYGKLVNMFNQLDFEVGNKYIDNNGHVVLESSRKDRISTKNTVHLNNGCEIYTTTDNIKIIIYKKVGDIYTFVDDAITKNQKIKIEDSGDYLIVIGVLPERSKEINNVNELLSYCYYTFEPYNVIEKIDDSLYTTYNTSRSNIILKTLDAVDNYAYYRVPRQINYGEKISVTIKSNSMGEQLPVTWNIITCNGFGEKYIDDTCGIQRKSYPNSINKINKQYDIEVKRDFKYIGLYINESKNADFELTISFKKSTAQSIQKDNILTVMTYNADRFSLVNSNEEMHSIILEKYGVDIAGIQEYRETINNNSIFTNVFTDYQYHHQNTLIPNPSGIVSKKKLFSVNDYLFTHQSKDEESPTEYVEVRGYTKSYIYVNGKKICWINTHIDLNEKTRYLQLAELKNIMLSEEYAILTGDLNTNKIIDSKSPEWENAIKPFLDSGLKCANNNDTYGYNWTWADLNFKKTSKVDNIIVTPNIDFVEVVFDKTRMDYINSTDVPEHNPIIVKLRIN